MLTALTHLALCQSKPAVYPIHISQISENINFANPATLNLKSKWEIAAYSKLYSGFYRNNNLSLFSASHRIGHKHNVGILGYYDKEGNYIDRYRIYLQYAFNVKLNHIWTSSLGTSLGVASIKAGDPNTTSYGQDNCFDGNIGIAFYNNSTTIGFSLLQIPQQNLQAISEKNILTRYTNINLSHDFSLNHKTKWTNFALISVYNNRKPHFQIKTGLLINEIVSVSLLHRWRQALGFMFGLESIKINNQIMKLHISYDVNVSNSYRNNSAELTLNYGVPYKKKVTKHD